MGRRHVITLSDYDLRNIMSLIGNVAVGKNPEFKEHFLTNRKLLTFYGDALMSMKDLSYGKNDYLDPHMEEYGKYMEVLKSNNTHLDYFSPKWKLHRHMLRKLMAKERPEDALPLGIIVDTPVRRNELYSLGDFRKTDFCEVLDYSERIWGTKYEGEIRLYDAPITVPHYIALKN